MFMHINREGVSQLPNTHRPWCSEFHVWKYVLPDACCHQMLLKRQGHRQITMSVAANVNPRSVEYMKNKMYSKWKGIFSSRNGKVSFIMSWLKCSSHLFHNYNEHHVFDTMLYMILVLGIKLKSVSVRSWRWTLLCLPWNPCITARVLLKRANLGFVLM